MTIAILIKKTFNWGGSHTVSEVQSIIILTGGIAVCRQADMVMKLRVLVLHKATGSQLQVTLRET